MVWCEKCGTDEHDTFAWDCPQEAVHCGWCGGLHSMDYDCQEPDEASR